MRTTRQHRPAWDRLESKELLSAVGGTMPAVAALVSHGHRGAHHGQVALLGTVSGTWSSQRANPDTGTTQTFNGSGRVAPLGQVQAVGSLQTPGFIAPGAGQTSGTFTLSNAQGSLTVQLVGPGQQDFSTPTRFTYTILSGTGAYRSDTGHGTALLQETPQQSPPPGPPGTATPNYIVAARFTLTFRP